MSKCAESYWCTEPNGCVDPRARSCSISPTEGIKSGEHKNNSEEDAKQNKDWEGGRIPRTVPAFIDECIRIHKDKIAFKQKLRIEQQHHHAAYSILRPSHVASVTAPHQWKSWTWQQYRDECQAFAKAVVSIGVSIFGVINIVGNNSPEWLIANNGTILAGCIPAGIDANSTPSTCQYLSSFERAEIVVLQGGLQLTKYTQELITLPTVKAIVVWDDTEFKDLLSAQVQSDAPRIFTWSQFIQLGATVTDNVVEDRQSALQPGNCATIIHTSGTTGPPKAVMLSHDNIVWTVDSWVQRFSELGDNERVLSYLPLSHIAAQLLDNYIMMKIGGCVYFTSPTDVRESFIPTLRIIKPTIFFGVPRVWEKLVEKLKAVESRRQNLKSWMLAWAKKIGTQHSDTLGFDSDKKKMAVPMNYRVAKLLVLNSIRKKIGLDETKLLMVGAAPVAPDVLRYLAQFDLQVLEAFGMSETCGPHTVNQYGAWKIGTCGRPICGTLSKVAVGTGELLLKGRHIFMGYMYNATATAAAIDSSGYFHSGDVVTFDDSEDPQIPSPSGFMTVVGRIKEIIVTAGGEKVSPVLLERDVKTILPALSNCMIIGDRRKFLSLLVTLPSTNDVLPESILRIGKEIGATATTYSEAKNDPAWAKYMDDGLKVVNISTTSTAMKVRKWVWLPTDFKEETGELNAQGKLTRGFILEKYADLINAIYAEQP